MLGILARAASQLKLFGMGSPITLALGFRMVGLVLPYLAVPLYLLIAEAIGVMLQLNTTLTRI